VCVQSLWGHHSAVRCLSYAPELDLVLSGSDEGLLCLHTVRKGRFIRSMPEMLGSPVDLVLAAAPGYLVAHSVAGLVLRLFWVNGQPLRTTTVSHRYVSGLASWSLQPLLPPSFSRRLITRVSPMRCESLPLLVHYAGSRRLWSTARATCWCAGCRLAWCPCARCGPSRSFASWTSVPGAQFPACDSLKVD